MCGDIKRITFLFTFLLGVVWFFMPMAAVAGKWPIKEFKVIQYENPQDAIDLANTLFSYSDNYTLSQWWEEATAPRLSTENIQEIERWLNEVAYYFESQGFRPPRYKAKGLNDNGKEVFEVYVLPYGDPKEDPGTARTQTDCDNPLSKTLIMIHPAGILENGKISPKGYQDLAHELFHTVQYAYPMFQGNCEQGAWITEGTAEAVGIETARILSVRIKPVGLCQMGLRPYSETLYVRERSIPKDNCGFRSYYTQSFWQFLGEYSTRKGFIATEKFVPPDFRYLHNFFNTTHAMGSESNEYGWLDMALRQVKRHGKQQFGISLQTAYSRFTGTFASYWKPERRKLYPDGSSSDPGKKEEQWMERIFGECEDVAISRDAPALLSISIEPVAARCIKMKFDFTGQVALTFFATGDNVSIDLDALTISTADGKKIIRHKSTEPHPDKIGKFSKITATKNVPKYFIVSNVAKKAGNTLKIDPVISIVPQIATTTLAKKKKEQERPDQTEKEELKNAGESRSWTGSARQHTRRPCKRPFEAQACGSVTDIDLSLVPDSVHILDTILQPTMSLERRYRIAEPIQENPEAFLSDFMDSIAEIQQQDGAKVSITIPQIQPGFTGSISNAHINVSRAGSSKDYQAVGSWAGSCLDGYRPSTGTVTIEEFSKYVLRGTFSANLMDMENVKVCESGPVNKSDSGSFSITRINWNINTEPPELDDDAVIDELVEDINETIPGLFSTEMLEYAKEQARKKRAQNEQKKKEKAASRQGGSVFQSCGCNCEMETTFCEENPNEKCCMSCEPVFKACKGIPKNRFSALTAEEQSNENAEVHAMRQRYEAYLKSYGMSGDIKEQMMDAFDQLKTVNEKRLLIMSIPGINAK